MGATTGPYASPGAGSGPYAPVPAPGVAADAPDLTEAENAVRGWPFAGPSLVRVMAEYDLRGAELEQLRTQLAALHGAALPEAGGDRRWICEGSGAGMGAIGGLGFTPCPKCRPAPGGDALGVETNND